MGKKTHFTAADAEAMKARLARHTPQPTGEYADSIRKAGFIPAFDPNPLKFKTEGPKRKPKGMNKTEARYAAILDIYKRKGEILDWEFEGVTLKLADDSRYTPDFAITLYGGHIRFVETKGGFIREAALVRFKVAKSKWKAFDFQLWQWKSGDWTHLL